MISRAAIKENAKAQLGGKLFGNIWLMAAVACLLVSAIQGLLGVIPTVGSIAVVLLSGALGVGLASVFLGLANGAAEVSIEKLFQVGFGNFSRNLLLGLMRSIFVALWSLLFVIPGIVKNYAYSMSYYIANDHADWTWKQCIDESKRLTAGHKWELFVLDLSFIGWYFVGGLCFGIGTLLVMPYHQTAVANYYEALKQLDSGAVA